MHGLRLLLDEATRSHKANYPPREHRRTGGAAPDAGVLGGMTPSAARGAAGTGPDLGKRRLIPGPASRGLDDRTRGS